MGTNLFDLSGKRALVTGGGSGIGLAMAVGLAGAGATVEIWGRTEARLAAAAEEHGLVPRRVDVSDETAVAAGIAAFVEDHGGLDVAVLAAGVGAPLVPFVQSSTESYRDVLATNLDGAYWTMREAARVMSGSGEGGSIIAVSSLAAVEGAGLNQLYAASKGGLVAMANGAAVELARHHVRVNTVLPGWIATEMTAAAQDSPVFTERVIPRVPLRRWGRPDELAGIAVYLASDAASYQTGTTTVVDGGYSMF